MSELVLGGEAGITRELDFPYYGVNSDPFGVGDRWGQLRDDPRFGATMDTLGRCNQNALASGLWHWIQVDGAKQLFAEDISLQAFFISWQEIFREQKNIIDMVGLISHFDLVNFPELFTGYGDGAKRSFHQNMVFNFSWFQGLMREYENQGFQPYDRFGEFRRMGGSRRGIAEKIVEQMRIYDSVNIQFDQGGGHGTMDFFFDVKTGETYIEMKDFIMGSNQDFAWCSDYFDQNNPFQSQQKLNFLYPMNYRGWVFPMIGVVKIVLKNIKGDWKNPEQREYAYLKQGGALRLIGDVTKGSDLILGQ